MVGELALTLTLLIAAGLMIHTLLSLRHTHTGFIADRVVTGEIYFPQGELPEDASGPKSELKSGPTLSQTFYEPLLERLQALPGTESVGITTVRPLEGNWDFSLAFWLANHPKPERSSESDALVRFTSTDYFRTMGILAAAGALFREHGCG